jgi:hypothetical protein
LLSIKAMKISNQLFKKVEELAEGVKKDFHSKGLVIPVKESNGSVKFNNYTIVRDHSGFYSIVSASNITIVSNINLPQSAIILANALALGRGTDHKIINYDKQYGFNSFEEEQCKRVAAAAAKKKEWDRMDTVIIKQNIAHQRAEYAKDTVLKSFEKFRRLR